MHRFRWVDRIVPLAEAAELRFGTAWDIAMRAWWSSIDTATGTLGESALERAMVALADHVIDHPGFDPYAHAMARAMLIGYHTRWFEESARWLPRVVQQRFKLPLRVWNDNRGGWTPSPYDLTGAMDAVVTERDTGFVYVVECKSSGEDIEPGGFYWRRLRVDGQASQYYLAAQHLAFRKRPEQAELDLGFAWRGATVYGVMYDVARKPNVWPAMETPVADRKFTKGEPCKACKATGVVAGAVCPKCHGTTWKDPPRLYATQRERDETTTEFEERCRHKIADAPEVHYVRGVVSRNVDEVRAYAAHARDWGRLMARGFDAPNPNSCTNYGRECDYLPVCEGRASITDTELFRSKPKEI